ncbi:MAG: Holliday junction resolvase RuvX [Clostridia bacterium]|nr:Holliday junction resolvase RuvX [Clostridia bacterium]
MERYVAFDIGDRRIGVAISDPGNTYALPSETYNRKGFRDDVAAVAQIAQEKGATCVVCGLPVNFDGSESVQTERARGFILELEKQLKVPVVCVDERFTTVMADDTLKSEGMRGEKRKKYVDALAAANILDGYLSRLQAQKKSEETDMNEDMDDETDDDEEYEEGIIELIDDQGETVKFTQIGTMEYKDVPYVFLVLAEPKEGYSDEDIFVFRYEQRLLKPGEDGYVEGEDNIAGMLYPIEDEALMEEVFEAFQNETDDEDEDEDDDEGDIPL